MKNIFKKVKITTHYFNNYKYNMKPDIWCYLNHNFYNINDDCNILQQNLQIIITTHFNK
jgi:hypothetical protein